MDRLHAMQVFVNVVQGGSFTRAADLMQLPRATVTNIIQNLEAHLGSRLLQRTTRKLSVTPDGEAYYERCLRLLADLEEAEGLFSQARAHPRGLVRVDLPEHLARRVIIPALPDFCARYPDIRLKLGVTDRLVDMVGEGVDCIVRVGARPDSSMVGRQVGELEQVNAAARAYLDRHGRPQTLEDLRGHTAISFFSAQTGREFAWEYELDGKTHTLPMPSRVAVNGAGAYLSCCLAGLGIMQAPRYGVSRYLASGELEEVLPQFRPAPMPVSVLMPNNRHLSPRVRVFVDWVSALLTGPALGGPESTG
jgi:DNA-binding transcriptional LysR family regulator